MLFIKRIKIISLLACFYSASALSNGHPVLKNSINHKNEVVNTVTRFNQALREKDAALVESILSKHVVVFENGKVEKSFDEYASYHMRSDMRLTSEVNADILWRDVNVYGDIAISLVSSKVTGKFRGQFLNYTSLETIILAKENNIWKITHIHWSK